MRLNHLLIVLLLSAPVLADDDPFRIAIVGDQTCRPHEGLEMPWPQRLEILLEDSGIPDVELIDVTAEGQTTESAAQVFTDAVLGPDPDFIVIQLGTSDSAMTRGDDGRLHTPVSKREFDNNMRRLVDRTLESRTRLVLATANPALWTPKLENQLKNDPEFKRDDRWGLDKVNAAFASRVRVIAKDRRVPLIDMHALIRKYDARELETAEDLVAGRFMTDLGHEILAARLAGVILRTRVRPDYGIKQVDLAGDASRQVVVDREPGQYLGHVTTTLLEDGKTMIAVYPKGHGRGAIVMKRSADGGRTWSERLPVPENWATSQEVPTIHRVLDPRDITPRLIMFSGLHPIRIARSEDDGLTWTPLEPVGDWGGIVAMSSCVTLADGRLLAMFHDDGRFFAPGGKRVETMTLYQTYSSDGGLTWQRPRPVYRDDAVHLCEPGVVHSPDGTMIAAMLRENRRVENSHVILSDDLGKSWTPPRPLPGALTGDRHTARYAPDGRLVVTFRDTGLASPTQGDWVAWVGHWDDLVEGREGEYRIRLMDNHHRWDCAYPGLEVLPDGTFVATTYGHWTEGEQPYIVSVRFSLDETDRLVAAP